MTLEQSEQYQIRMRAMELAVSGSSLNDAAETVVTRAEAYTKFLMGATVSSSKPKLAAKRKKK